jgi:hypothetical protein
MDQKNKMKIDGALIKKIAINTIAIIWASFFFLLIYLPMAFMAREYSFVHSHPRNDPAIDLYFIPFNFIMSILAANLAIKASLGAFKGGNAFLMLLALWIVMCVFGSLSTLFTKDDIEAAKILSYWIAPLIGIMSGAYLFHEERIKKDYLALRAFIASR